MLLMPEYSTQPARKDFSSKIIIIIMLLQCVQHRIGYKFLIHIACMKLKAKTKLPIDSLVLKLILSCYRTHLKGVQHPSWGMNNCLRG